MFQPSHFQKVAKHLGMNSATYESEYEAFLAKLRKFHQSKGTPFRRLPWLGGQHLDLYLLYRKVTAAGGWVKVTEEKRWREIAEVFNLPPTCTNAAFALRQHYTRYLESFERINFLGEDVEDVLNSSRPHTPVASFITTTSDYTLPSFPEKDPSRNFDKLVLSLQSGLPNEVDFGINICMLLSNVSNSVFNLQKAPAVIDALLAHAGIFSEASHGLRNVYREWYKDNSKDLLKFWRDVLIVREVRELVGEWRDYKNEDTDEAIFGRSSRVVNAKDVESQRVVQICLIVYNFSFDVTNATVLANHSSCLKFLLMCVCSKIGFLQRVAWETLSNMAENIVLDPVESTTTQVLFQTLHHFLEDKDRFHVLSAMEFIGKLCMQERNDDVIEEVLDVTAYESLVRVLVVHDVQLVIASLEALYNLSGVGQTTSDHIAAIHRSIDILVCLVTLEVESFGLEALAEVNVVENRRVVPRMTAAAATAVPASPAPAAPPARVASPVGPQPPAQSPQPAAQPAGRREIDAETFTYSWLQATYEAYPASSVSRIDLYADYLSSCSRLARVGILNATSFNRVVKLAFPDVQLRRVQSATQTQYALVGVRRKASPLPVQTHLDQRQSVVAQRAPVPQGTPTPPPQGQSPPAWNTAGQARVGQQAQAVGPSPARRNSLVAGRPATPEALPQPASRVQRPQDRPQDRPSSDRIATLQRLNAERAALLQQRQQQQEKHRQAQPQRSAAPRVAAQNSPLQSQGASPASNLRPIQPQAPHQAFPPTNDIPQPFVPRNPSQDPNTGHPFQGHSPVAQAGAYLGTPQAPLAGPLPEPRPMAGYNLRSNNGPPARPARAAQNSAFTQQTVQEQALAPGSARFASPQLNYRQGSPLTSTVPPTQAQLSEFSQPQASPVVSGQRILPRLAPNPAQLVSLRQQSPAAGSAVHGVAVPVARQPNKHSPAQRPSRPTDGGGPDGMVLIAREERAQDIGAAELVEGVEEQAIVVVENTNRPGATHDRANPAKNCIVARTTNGENHSQGRSLSSTAGAKRDGHFFNTSAPDFLSNHDGGEEEGAKRRKLERKTPSLNNDNAFSPQVSQQDANNPMVNGDLKDDHRNKLIDKLLDKDLHIPLNGICGIDPAELDLMASDADRLSGSKASTPDLLDSETNSDFGKYLEEGDTDTALFSDILSGDLRIDPIENGSRKDAEAPSGAADVQEHSTCMAALKGSFPDRDAVPGAGRAGADAVMQEKVPIPAMHPEKALAGNLYNRYVQHSQVDNGPPVRVGAGSAAPGVWGVNSSGDPTGARVSSGFTGRADAPGNAGTFPVNRTKAAVTPGASVYEASNAQSRRGLPAPAPMLKGAPPIAPSAGPIRPAPVNAPPTLTNSTHGSAFPGVPRSPGVGSAPPVPSGNVPIRPAPLGATPNLPNSTHGSAFPGASRSPGAGSSPPVPSGNVPIRPAPLGATPNPASSVSGYPGAPHSQGGASAPPVPPGNALPAGSAIEGLEQFARDGVPGGPPVESFKPYRCRWETCTSSFDSGKTLWNHVINTHVPRDNLMESCMWEGCPYVKRSRSSVIFHLEQKHLKASAPSAPHPPPSQPTAGPPMSQPQAHPPAQVSMGRSPPQPHSPAAAQPSITPAYHFVARMLQSFQGEEESPLTRTIRLTAALVLRNIAQYSAAARSMLRRHERHLSLVAMSNSEAAHAVAACLSELSPHRKPSSEHADTFVWAATS